MYVYYALINLENIRLRCEAVAEKMPKKSLDAFLPLSEFRVIYFVFNRAVFVAK